MAGGSMGPAMKSYREEGWHLFTPTKGLSCILMVRENVHMCVMHWARWGHCSPYCLHLEIMFSVVLVHLEGLGRVPHMAGLPSADIYHSSGGWKSRLKILIDLRASSLIHRWCHLMSLCGTKTKAYLWDLLVRVIISFMCASLSWPKHLITNIVILGVTVRLCHLTSNLSISK